MSPVDVLETIAAHARLFDIATEAVIATTTSGEIVYWNDTATRLYGWPRDEVLGRNILDVTPTEATREQAAEIMQSLLAGRSWSGEFGVRRRNGDYFLARVQDIPVRLQSGELAGIIGVSIPANQPAQD